MIAGLLLSLLAPTQPPSSAAQAMRRCPGGVQVPAGMQCPSYCPWIVYFDRSSAALTGDMRATLDEVARTFAAHPNGPLRLTGHSDASEDAGLSLARAEAMRDYLVSRGLSASLIRVEGRGNREPAIVTPPGQPEAQNRGVYINMVE